MPKLKPKSPKADFSLQASEGDAVVLRLSGQWVITQLEGIAARLESAVRSKSNITVNADDLDAMDTAGAFTLRKSVEGKLLEAPFTGHDNYVRLYNLVGTCKPELDIFAKESARKTRFWLHPVYFGLVECGRLIAAFWRHFIDQAIFMGHIITLLMISIARPGRVRWAALVNIMQRAGLEAIPIIAMTNLFVGAVLAFLMVLSLKTYGGAVFAIDFVSIGVLREFAPIIAAVLICGRSASAFAAEIGSMKMNQEIDAMRVMGIDPYEALVLPRVVALVIMTPLVTFIGSMAGLLGGSLAIWAALGLGPNYFVQRFYDYVPSVNFFVGMIRTPIFAIIIALIGCRLGMTVKDDVISLGRQVTTAVVQSIFVVFLVDALFAILFNGFTF